MGQVTRSHLVNVRRKWRRKMILMSQASISKGIRSIYKDAQFKENAPEVDSEFFLVVNAEYTPNDVVSTTKRKAAKIFDDF